MTINHVFAGVAVPELEPAVAWDTRLFGSDPEMRPNEREAVWQLASAASIYVEADPDRAGRSKLSLIVDDLERHGAEMAERGPGPVAIETGPGVFRKAVIADPDGNEIQLGQVLG